ncbi:MAG TPA: RsmE family RNA methyltransferase [Bacteriovoracaceae bacterium]|nr:RsmE family RNA methyltransferase [Bacteriovoracaceae bacterium]
MRAIWLPEIKASVEHVLTGEPHHHLVNVARIEVQDELMLLDGKGLRAKTTVTAANKKEIRLQENSRELVEPRIVMDLALGIPKRDALELALKQATELGFRRIYLIRAGFSQMKVPEFERMQKLLVSALEQSNSPFMPEILEKKWNEIPWDEYGLKLMMDSQTLESTKVAVDLSQPSLLLVGPEAGFASIELSFLHARPGLEILNLPTPILRTPTAVAAGAGCLLQRLIERR